MVAVTRYNFDDGRTDQEDIREESPTGKYVAYSDLESQLAEKDKRIGELEAKHRWHLYPAEKPDKPGKYLVTEQWAGLRDVFINEWNGLIWIRPYNSTFVTAWQPLPEPFKEER